MKMGNLGPSCSESLGVSLMGSRIRMVNQTPDTLDQIHGTGRLVRHERNSSRVLVLDMPRWHDGFGNEHMLPNMRRIKRSEMGSKCAPKKLRHIETEDEVIESGFIN